MEAKLRKSGGFSEKSKGKWASYGQELFGGEALSPGERRAREWNIWGAGDKPQLRLPRSLRTAFG